MGVDRRRFHWQRQHWRVLDRKAPILRAWHGTNGTVLPHLLADGLLLSLRRTTVIHLPSAYFHCVSLILFRGFCDSSWFGKGIYMTTNADYALRYAKKPKCLLICCVHVL